MKCPQCDAEMDRCDAGTFNDRYECPFDAQIVWAAQANEDVAIQVSGKLHRIRQLLDKRSIDPHLRLEFIAAIEHGEGCGCYYCLGPRPGISPPPLEIGG